MISSINGYYTGLNYPLRTNAVNTNELSANNDFSLVKGAQFVANNENINQLPQQIQVNTLAKMEEVAQNKENANQSSSSLPNDIASLISIIESSRKISAQAPVDSLFEALPQVPQSQGQLIITDANSLDIKKDEVINELVSNFNKVDTNKDHLVSYNEALAFITRY